MSGRIGRIGDRLAAGARRVRDAAAGILPLGRVRLRGNVGPPADAGVESCIVEVEALFRESPDDGQDADLRRWRRTRCPGSGASRAVSTGRGVRKVPRVQGHPEGFQASAPAMTRKMPR